MLLQKVFLIKCRRKAKTKMCADKKILFAIRLKYNIICFQLPSCFVNKSLYPGAVSQKYLNISRSGHAKCSVKDFVYFTGKHLCWSLFSIKLQSSGPLRTPILKNNCDCFYIFTRLVLSETISFNVSTENVHKNQIKILKLFGYIIKILRRR